MQYFIYAAGYNIPVKIFHDLSSRVQMAAVALQTSGHRKDSQSCNLFTRCEFTERPLLSVAWTFHSNSVCIKAAAVLPTTDLIFSLYTIGPSLLKSSRDTYVKITDIIHMNSSFMLPLLNCLATMVHRHSQSNALSIASLAI